MKAFRREPRLGVLVLLLVGLMAAFIVVPQLAVVLAPGPSGYVDFFREGPNWGLAARNSLVVMVLSTTTSVILGFCYA